MCCCARRSTPSPGQRPQPPFSGRHSSRPRASRPATGRETASPSPRPANVAIASADALAQRYGGTEIAEQARSLIAPTEAELDALELGREEDELARLEAIRLALLGQGQVLLADAVQELLNQKQGGGR